MWPKYYIRPYEIVVLAWSNTNIDKLTSGCFRNSTKCLKLNNFELKNVTSIKVWPKHDNTVCLNYYLRPYEIVVLAWSNINVNKLTSGCFRNSTKCFWTIFNWKCHRHQSITQVGQQSVTKWLCLTVWIWLFQKLHKLFEIEQCLNGKKLAKALKIFIETRQTIWVQTHQLTFQTADANFTDTWRSQKFAERHFTDFFSAFLNVPAVLLSRPVSFLINQPGLS